MHGTMNVKFTTLLHLLVSLDTLDSDDPSERAVIFKVQNLELGLQTLQYEGNTLPQNVGIQLPTDTASYP
jgi:hypothetical protein